MAVRLQHHSTFYFPLGDLVVQSAVGEDGIGLLFRVSKSVLAFNSAVFADMFGFPAAADQELYEGAPVVHLMDSAVDLAAFFSALYDPRCALASIHTIRSLTQSWA